MLLPFIFAMIIGVIQMGLQMHGYNAVRSVAAETARYVIIQYQNRTLVSMNQITDKAEAIAANAPYGLDLNNMQVTVTDPASGIAGTKKFSIQITYQPMSILGFVDYQAPPVTVVRPVFVKS